MLVTNTVIANNNAVGVPGGVFCQNSTIVFDRSSVFGNSAKANPSDIFDPSCAFPDAIELSCTWIGVFGLGDVTSSFCANINCSLDHCMTCGGNNACENCEKIPYGPYCLATAAIAGIAVGCSVFVAIVITTIVVVILIKRKKLGKSETSASRDNSIIMESADQPRWKELNDVKIGEKIGSGAFGAVFKGEWNHATVALKSLLKASSIEDYANELELLSELSHPNIVQFLGLFIDKKTSEAFMVLEYLPLGSGLDFVKDEKGNLHESDLIVM